MGGSAIAAADGMGGEEKWSKLAKRGPKSLNPESGKNSELRAVFIN